MVSGLKVVILILLLHTQLWAAAVSAEDTTLMKPTGPYQQNIEGQSLDPQAGSPLLPGCSPSSARKPPSSEVYTTSFGDYVTTGTNNSAGTAPVSCFEHIVRTYDRKTDHVTVMYVYIKGNLQDNVHSPQLWL